MYQLAEDETAAKQQQLNKVPLAGRKSVSSSLSHADNSLSQSHPQQKNPTYDRKHRSDIRVLGSPAEKRGVDG